MLDLQNKIYNMDCYEGIKQIPSSSVNCIYTDVPYLYNNGGEGSSNLSKRIFKTTTTLSSSGIDSGFDYSILSEFVRVLKKINCFIWCSKLQILDILNWFVSWSANSGRKITYEILVWAKTNPTPACNNVWLPDLEYCLYFRESGVPLNPGYSHKHKWYSSGLNVLDKKDFLHPTCKPVDCIKNHLAHTTQPGDLVLDPFLGSGSTCVACKELGRSYCGFEINPDFFKSAQDRLSGFNSKGEMNLFMLE